MFHLSLNNLKKCLHDIICMKAFSVLERIKIKKALQNISFLSKSIDRNKVLGVRPQIIISVPCCPVSPFQTLIFATSLPKSS